MPRPFLLSLSTLLVDGETFFTLSCFSETLRADDNLRTLGPRPPSPTKGQDVDNAESGDDGVPLSSSQPYLQRRDEEGVGHHSESCKEGQSLRYLFWPLTSSTPRRLCASFRCKQVLCQGPASATGRIGLWHTGERGLDCLCCAVAGSWGAGPSGGRSMEGFFYLQAGDSEAERKGGNYMWWGSSTIEERDSRQHTHPGGLCERCPSCAVCCGRHGDGELDGAYCLLLVRWEWGKCEWSRRISLFFF